MTPEESVAALAELRKIADELRATTHLKAPVKVDERAKMPMKNFPDQDREDGP